MKPWLVLLLQVFSLSSSENVNYESYYPLRFSSEKRTLPDGFFGDEVQNVQDQGQVEKRAMVQSDNAKKLEKDDVDAAENTGEILFRSAPSNEKKAASGDENSSEVLFRNAPSNKKGVIVDDENSSEVLFRSAQDVTSDDENSSEVLFRSAPSDDASLEKKVSSNPGACKEGGCRGVRCLWSFVRQVLPMIAGRLGPFGRCLTHPMEFFRQPLHFIFRMMSRILNGFFMFFRNNVLHGFGGPVLDRLRPIFGSVMGRIFSFGCHRNPAPGAPADPAKAPGAQPRPKRQAFEQDMASLNPKPEFGHRNLKIPRVQHQVQNPLDLVLYVLDGVFRKLQFLFMGRFATIGKLLEVGLGALQELRNVSGHVGKAHESPIKHHMFYDFAR